MEKIHKIEIADSLTGLYNNFTTEEIEDIGKKFRAICIGNKNYAITVGKEYEIEISERILPHSPLCKFTDDNGKSCVGHLTRFKKIEK
jgi:hypothetical protein